MNKKEIELCIKQALDDPSIFGEPALRRVLEHTFSDSREEFGQQDLIPYHVLILFSAQLLLDAYLSLNLVLARGLLLFHIRFFDAIYSQKSVATVFKAVKEGDPGLAKRLHEDLTNYCRKGRLEPISESDLTQWMIHQMGSVDERTAERHYKDGLDKFYAGLIKVAPGLAGDGPNSQEIPSPKVSQTSVTTSEFDLVQALKQAMRDECGFAPRIFGYKLPITGCLSRRVGYENEQIELEEIPGALGGQFGLISGIPGSGRSTLMRQIAYLDASYEDNGQCVYCLSAKYIQNAANVNDPLMAIARQVLARQPSNDLRKIREQLKQLDQEDALILLIDDLEHLQQHQQKRVVERACKLASAYFVVTPERAAWLNAKFRESGRRPVKFELPPLDGPSRDALARKLSPHFGMEQPAAVQYLSGLPEPAALVKTPLGVCAAVHSMTAPLHVRDLFMRYQVLAEWVRRHGYELQLASRFDDLNPVSSALYTLGGNAYEFWRAGSPDPSFANRPLTWSISQRVEEARLGDSSGVENGALSANDLFRLPFFEQHDSSWTRFRSREFETLLAAIFLFYHPKKRRRGPFAAWTDTSGGAMTAAERDSQRIGDLQSYLLTLQSS